MPTKDTLVFTPDISPDLEHAPLIREEALDWLETRYPGILSFATRDVLRMAGEPGRRWLIARLRAHNIGDEAEFSLPDTADALTILFLRSKGMKFRDAVDAIAGKKEIPRSSEPRYGGIWNRLIVANLERLRRRIPPRLLGAAVATLLPDPKDHANCLIIVRRYDKQSKTLALNKVGRVNQEYAYRAILERPAPSCSVIAPSGEVLFLPEDQLPARSEMTSRHFVVVPVATEQGNYEFLVGTMRPISIHPDEATLQFVGRILNIVFLHFDSFLKQQSLLRLETPVEPASGPTMDLQLWLISQFLVKIYGGGLCEISEISRISTPNVTKVLASSAANPWEPAPWEPAKSLEMLSGYSSLTGVPLVVETVEQPWISVIESVESELRYLKSQSKSDTASSRFSALALPVTSSSGNSIGSLYMLVPRVDTARLNIEVRLLTVFSRIVGEIIDRQNAAVYSSKVATDIASVSILKQEQFEIALIGLLSKNADELRGDGYYRRDVRLPFLLLSAYRPDTAEYDPAISGPLKDWLVATLRHLEWRSFVRMHMGDTGEFGTEAFIGEVPGVGMMIALGDLVTKDELDQIRGAFPTTINRTSPTNAPVKLVAWVLDIPAQRILDAADRQAIPVLAEKIRRWAVDVTTLVDDVAQSTMLAHEQGEWDAALHKVRQAINKEGGRSNAYLRRIASECCFSLGDWPGALKYAREADRLSRQDLGSGLVRSLCLEGDAHLCSCNPTLAWDLYSEATSIAPSHPLPRYYRGQAMLLVAKLLRAYQDECLVVRGQDKDQMEKIEANLSLLVDSAMEDLTLAADLLDHWGLIPESYQYRNFHLVPTLLGQASGYLLVRSPGPAASRFQSAYRSFPKDDIFFREFLFAKCWEQGIHRQYAALTLSDDWAPLVDRIRKTLGATTIFTSPTARNETDSPQRRDTI